MEKEQKQNQPDASNELESLEAKDTTVVSADGAVDATGGVSEPENNDKKPKKKRNAIKGLAGKFNIYLLLFMLILVIASMVSVVGYMRSQQQANKQDVNTEPLSQEALDKLRQTDVKVGDPKQILSVESNAIFAGKVLIRDSLEVAGQIKVGGPLNLPGISVSGNSSFDQVRANNLEITGNTTIQGQLGVQNNLTVTGSGTFGGTLTAGRMNIESLQLNGDLQINRHIDAGGGTPGKSDGGALGAGGTSSVSGTDTAGTIAINTGGGGGVGCFVTISFTQKFNGTPHVVVTPVGSAAGGLAWYINRSSNSFSVCTASPAPAGQSFAFDYIAID